ncbi:hypothetical protein HanXRQr2_Chr12g0552821 [Helianthus annuus]|uniref:Uncharacterized protein n=1 Tax=Helianthus annuus TaxID=4232 RepID=A0A9K3HIC8_HELAN|nr:hypothetical protein HanXRQr2_Chr12g0552821 [Helianthus annuus]KAJ0863625.1 hypothetical protein HanPSC8_Chr12g0532221 [Helianthus annuus]
MTHSHRALNPHQGYFGKNNRPFGNSVYFNVGTINPLKIIKEAILFHRKSIR